MFPCFVISVSVESIVCGLVAAEISSYYCLSSSIFVILPIYLFNCISLGTIFKQEFNEKVILVLILFTIYLIRLMFYLKLFKKIKKKTMHFSMIFNFVIALFVLPNLHLLTTGTK